MENINIEKYINTKTAIHCETEEESVKINELIVKHGGRNLHHLYKRYNDTTCYNLDNMVWNTYENVAYFLGENYEIIKAKDILNKNEIMKHTFKNGTTIEGSFSKEQLNEIAKVFGESLFPIYNSATKGEIPVNEMNEIHLRNAILLHLRDYFTQKNFKNMDNESFLDNLEVQNFPETIEMLINELNRRLSV